MSLIHEVLKYIEAHPGSSAASLRLVFPHVPRTWVQRAAYRLFESGFTTREMIKGQYCYFAAKSYPETGGMPIAEITRARGLVCKAQELESKGLFLRAATVWLEAFDASRLSGCSSTPNVQRTERPAPPAWMMQPAPDLLTPLNGIISPLESESKQAEK